MEQVAPAGPVYQAGTLSGNPLATAAGCAALRLLRRGEAYPRLAALTASLASGLAEAATGAGLDAQVVHLGSLLTVFFTAQPVRDYDHARTADTRRYARFFHGMLDRGIYLPPSQFEVLFLDTAHTETDVEATLEAARAAFGDVATLA